MPAAHWYTLIRFNGRPERLTAVCQARTAVETLALLDDWEVRFASETTVVFDPRNRPLERPALEWLTYGSPSRGSQRA
ncbi:MAG TPA: hypothetical protein VFD32_01015 [Dehalococcoidia bacterium]|nr:hypothetical protein [Dehalococcoidia bacterium]